MMKYFASILFFLFSIACWQYKEAGTSNEEVIIAARNGKAKIHIPSSAKMGDTIHIIVEGKDNGKPALTGYQRVVLTIK